MVERILTIMLPGQMIDYLYVDGHGNTQGMAMGPRVGSRRVVHEVRRGDTLWAIAKRYYGSPLQWRLIYQHNRSIIGRDPDRILPGQKLTVPSMVPVTNVDVLRRLRSRFAAGATVFLGGCNVGQNEDLVRNLSKLWGVHVRAGHDRQSGLLPGAEGKVTHCYLEKCNVESATWWGVREGR